MRILLSFAGGTGHFRPLLPLARALVERGREAAFAAQPAMLPAIAEAGFAGFATGGATLRDATTRTALLPPDMAREARAVQRGFAGRVAAERADALLALIPRWRPDALLCDEMDFGAMLAAERLGLPFATLLVIASGRLARAEWVAPGLALWRAAQGLPPDPDLAMPARHLLLCPFPPGLRDPAAPLPATALAFRPGTPPASPPPSWLAAAPRPVIHATLGTVFNLECGDLFRRLQAGLGPVAKEAGGSLVLTTGPQIDPAELGPQPPHIHLVRWLDQTVLLPFCNLVVSHGGSGTVAAALAQGLPQLLLPMGADQPFNAARCAALGVGLALDPVSATPEAIGAAARGLLADGPARRAAQAQAAAFATLPGQEVALTRLESLARA